MEAAAAADDHAALEQAAARHEALKRALDPQGLLNPDKFVTVSGVR
jgi:FAD/FMN-containing dehydrogenase